jgi:predicted metalloprotease with PDZ domain
LNAVYPHDWAGFFKSRIDAPGQPAPLAGIEMAGYRLVFRDEPNPFDKALMGDSKYLSLFYSLGIAIDKDNKVSGCRWDSPAFNAGIVPGAKIIAVNGIAYDQDILKDAITAAKTGGPAAGKPIELILQRGDRVQTVALDYHEGLRWPWLERAVPGHQAAPLDLLLAPRRAGAK